MNSPSKYKDGERTFIAALLAYPRVFNYLRGEERGTLVKALRRYEWSHRNDQCPICYGSLHRQSAYVLGAPSEGHRGGCLLVAAMEQLEIRCIVSHPTTEKERQEHLDRSRISLLQSRLKHGRDPKFTSILRDLHDTRTKGTFLPWEDPLLKDNPYLQLFDSLNP